MYAIYETSMSSQSLRRVEAFGEFASIDDAVLMLRDHPARVRFWDRDEDYDAADVLMANGKIYAIQKPDLKL
jgi:hypothetical protein